MANNFVIKSEELPSAIFGGFASEVFKQSYTSVWKSLVYSATKLKNKISKELEQAKSLISKGLNFFAQWWLDDPIPATAGALAVGLSLGVIVIVGGTAVGAISGGISAFRGLSIIGKAIAIASAAGILGGLIRFAVRGIQYAWNFNINITDSQIKEQQQSLINSLYGQAGNVVGTGLATLLCGAAPIEIAKRTNLVKVNPVALARIKELQEFDPRSDEYGEVYEEIMESMKALVQAGARVASQVAFIESYKNVRKWIKQGTRNSGLSKIFPGLAKLIEKWGAEGSQSWTIAEAIEESIESIDDTSLRSFTEEAVESFMDVCTEQVMIFSYIF